MLIDRPFHLTFEVQEQREGERFSRLRLVPGVELNAEALAETGTDAGVDEQAVATPGDEQLALVDEEQGRLAACSARGVMDESAPQTLTTAEIEELKRKGGAAGKELIAKLLLSHTAINQKSAFALAKYKLLKEKKFLRRFTILPLGVTLLGQWMLQERDAARILDMRPELLALVACWADVHFGGPPVEGATAPYGGRWLAVDDTGGLLVAAMAERMGILYRDSHQPAASGEDQPDQRREQATSAHATQGVDGKTEGKSAAPCSSQAQRSPLKRPRRDDMGDHYALTNTITVIHSNSQPNLSLLRYFDYDFNDANPPPPHHPLSTHLLPISWLQVVSPGEDSVYGYGPPEASAEELATWKTNRRGNYHRKRRRWARTRQIVDSTRSGGFSGLAVASLMDPVSILRHALPFLAGGSPIAIYSPTVESLTQLADCFTIARRTAWITCPPRETEGQSAAELARWKGTPEFPINPTLVVGAALQTSRVRRWQVLPGRTHPFMTARGASEGYLFTAWRAIPAEGKVSARGKFQRKRACGS